MFSWGQEIRKHRSRSLKPVTQEGKSENTREERQELKGKRNILRTPRAACPGGVRVSPPKPQGRPKELSPTLKASGECAHRPQRMET